MPLVRAAHVADAEDSVRGGDSIYSALIWTRETARFESRTERRIRENFLSMLVSPEDAFLRASLQENDAFRASLIDAWAAREFSAQSGKEVSRKLPDGRTAGFFVPKGTAGAAANIEAITDNILDRLKTIAAGRNPGKVILKPEHLRAIRQMRSLEPELA